ncbi:putative transcription factor WRKY family [Helianthus annuus]|nr:putative transcription factor WRKY family [Helianthus annuus]
MESACVYDEKKLIHELTQGKQMTEQLMLIPNSVQAKVLLIQKILSNYDNAVSLLDSGLSAAEQLLPPALPVPDLIQSPMSFGSPGSEALKYDQPFSGQQGENIISKKRKRATSENKLESDNYDGYNWRKYGQKDILGARFPRSYYRCSYRNAQKCFATKYVQRTDEDPAEFEIVYKGKHTCNHASQSASPPLPSPEKHEITPTHHHHQLSPPSPSEMTSNLSANLSVNTLDLGCDNDTIPSLFSFPSASSGLMEDYHQLQFPSYYDNEFFPVTSESFYFSECGSSQSLDFLADPAGVAPSFKFNSLLEG